METLPWKADPLYPESEHDVLQEGGHISDIMYTTGDRGMEALINYIKYFKGQKKKDPEWDMDWVGRELIYSEFAFEAYNRTPLTHEHPAGGMSYSEREDTIRHQCADLWIMRWQNYGIHKRFKIDLMDWMDLEYPVAEWLLRRARMEEERRQQELAKAEKDKDDQAPPAHSALGDIDSLSDYLGLEDEE